MNVRKGICLAVLSLSILLGLAAVSLADDMSGMDMGGMNMGGNSTVQRAPSAKAQDNAGMSNGSQNQPAAASMQSGQNENMSGMDPNMPGMDMNANPVPHKAGSGMDPNMPGMSSGTSAGHSGNGTAAGVNSAVVGGFSAINLLVITAAGILKYKKGTPI